MDKPSASSWHLPGELRLKSLLLALVIFLFFDTAVYFLVSREFAGLSKPASARVQVDQNLENLDRRIARIEQQVTTIGAEVDVAKNIAKTAQEHAAAAPKTTDLSRSECIQLKREVQQLRLKATNP